MSIAALASRDGNEAAATLKVLQSLDLKGWVLTADALNRHPKMAEGVRATGAHYALKLKANNGPLFACALQAFAQADASGALAFHETNEEGHDRFERRRASIVASPKGAPPFPGSSRSAGSKANGAPRPERPRLSLITSPCPNACRPKQ